MERTEFFRRQAERFSALALECHSQDIRARLLGMASEYRGMLNGKESDNAQESRSHVDPLGNG
jgi:hypothetical protein